MPGRADDRNRADGAHAAVVVAALRPGLTACYRHALKSRVFLGGNVVLRIRVECDGSVSRLSLSNSPPADDFDDLPPQLTNCIFSAAQVSRFEPPVGGFAVIGVPIRFVLDDLSRSPSKQQPGPDAH